MLVKDLRNRVGSKRVAVGVLPLFRAAILEGYEDAVAGRTLPFKGDLRGLLKKVK